MISIIMPVYKAERYLDRAVTSVLNQTYTNFELLLVDDQSPDNSGTMCDEWAKKDSRIKSFHKPNGGTSDARNFGIEKSQGDYITFIDCDDFVMPNWLLDMYTVAKETDADIVKGGIYYVPETDVSFQNAELDYNIKPFMTVKFNCESISPYEYHCRLANINGYSAVWNQLVKSDIHKKCLFLSGHLSEDYYIFFSLLEHAKNIQITDKIGYCWGQRELSQSRLLSNLYIADYIVNYSHHCEIFKNQFNDIANANKSLFKAMEYFFYHLVGVDRIKTIDKHQVREVWKKLQQACRCCNVKSIVPSALYLQYLLCSVSLPFYIKLVCIKKAFFKQ